MILMKDMVRDDKDSKKVLRSTAKQVSFPLSEEDQKLAAAMMKYLEDSQDPKIAEKHQLRAGVGLAAPQVGVSEMMAAVLVPGEDGDAKPIFKEVIVNPKIRSYSVQNAAIAEGEGCLSVFRDVPGYVIRHEKITFTYQDLDGNEHKVRLKGYPAIVCQHEIDHLNGILFYDHINKQKPFEMPDDTTVIE
ncbi:def protein [Lactobacillus selangorensis]|uniref:Peptide deformylase n=1 Tax=Lactobacillus selangorensis TaxID=81857 RepID=A0A0R2GB82_9LACO|nr:peptide deformylase [Lactobacillus selangorensis]KRN29387.1 def protein [Lactobacillus selangorensis]KRN34084.1 def protein [Lactobacillus selangorensis]